MADGLKRYRVIPLDDPDKLPSDQRVIAATGDFDALAQARHRLGSEVAFDLWDGERLVLGYRPTPGSKPPAGLRLRR